MRSPVLRTILLLTTALACGACSRPASTGAGATLTDDALENLVRRSYPYVTMFNVNNKFALKQGGWNTVGVDTALKDHTMREIARPNNDTLYISCMLDLRHDPAILDIPAFGSDYASLMITAYDHYVNVPLSTRNGDFAEPQKMLIYSARTAGYQGQPVEGIDRIFEASGDFVSAIFRVMPHANDPERFADIIERMRDTRLTTLSMYRGGEAKPIDDPHFPAVGANDFDSFESNLVDVMQFVFDHTTFDEGDDIDRAVLAAWEPLGVVPGGAPDPSVQASLDGKRIREVAERVAAEEMAKSMDPTFQSENGLLLFKPKGQMTQERLLYQSVIGPIGLPASEAVYPMILTTDGAPMNAMHDYVIRMPAQNMPPAEAFWSFTLYDTKNGFFIPNDRKKYSVGKNAGMKLAGDGSIEVHIAATRPDGVPLENWLPLERGDYDIDVILRIYAPDLERYRTWTAPRAEMQGSPSTAAGMIDNRQGPADGDNLDSIQMVAYARLSDFDRKERVNTSPTRHTR